MSRNRTPPHPSVEVQRKDGKDMKAAAAFEIQEFRIAEFIPKDAEASNELHLLMRIAALNSPIIARFKGPETLGFLIEELIAYKQKIWPDSPMPFPLSEKTLADVTESLEPDDNTLKDVTNAPTV